MYEANGNVDQNKPAFRLNLVPSIYRKECLIVLYHFSRTCCKRVKSKPIVCLAEIRQNEVALAQRASNIQTFREKLLYKTLFTFLNLVRL